MKTFFYSLLLLIFTQIQLQAQLQNGDLLLVKAKSDGISAAIDRVTQKKSTANYSHIAMIEKKGKKLWVLHAGSEKGSERISLKKFIQKRENKNLIDVYRLKEEFQNSIPNAIETAKTWLGKPYNYSYILSDDELYCSDFVQRSFVKDSIFGLEPMTFVNPKTGKIDTVWTDYYKDMNLEVPEGQPGCNPNGLAASDKLYFVGNLEEIIFK